MVSMFIDQMAFASELRILCIFTCIVPCKSDMDLSFIGISCVDEAVPF